MNIVNEFRIHIEQRDGFEFVARFDNDQFPPLAMDEPPPLGQDHGPNAARVLAAAIGNCLSASLLFCARKARVTSGPITAAVAVKIGRTESGRLRIAGVDVEIDPNIAPEDREKAARCLDIFEDFCTVTQSIRQGIPVSVVVK